MRRNGSSSMTLRSANQGSRVSFSLDEAPAEQFARYVYGCLALVSEGGASVPGLDIEIESDVPIGVGLSFSAALEVATLRCLRELLGLALNDVTVARLAQRAEVEFAGVSCGIMDQLAASLASTEAALLIDTRTLERREVPLPPGSAVLVLDSGVARSLADSGYNQRRLECEEASRRLGKASLRDVESLHELAGLDDVLLRRARHVFSENARVLDAALSSDANTLGRLMNQSHASLREDFEVSTLELDTLVGLLQRHPNVHGARLTGAGFGGACVALCRNDALSDVSRGVLEQYRYAGYRGRELVPRPEAPSG